MSEIRSNKAMQTMNLLSLNEDGIQNYAQRLILKVLRMGERWKLFGR